MDLSSEKAMTGLEGFVHEFHSDRVSELEELNEKIQIEDFDYVCATAHRWKGFCGPYGFVELERLSLAIEKEAVNKDLTKVISLFNEVKEYLVLKGKHIQKG